MQLIVSVGVADITSTFFHFCVSHVSFCLSTRPFYLLFFFVFFVFERPISYSNDPDTSRSSQSAVCLSAVCFYRWRRKSWWRDERKFSPSWPLGSKLLKGLQVNSSPPLKSQRGRNLNLDQVSRRVGSDLRQTHAAVFYPLKARRRLKIWNRRVKFLRKRIQTFKCLDFTLRFTRIPNNKSTNLKFPPFF